MLNTRVSTKLICAAIVAVFLIVSTDLFPAAIGCPGPAPMPLRALYNASVRIVVARVGGSQVIRAEDRYLTVKTALHVSSTVKGKDDQTVIYFERFVRNEGVLASPDYSSGDTVLVFLTRRENEEGYKILDRSFGIKRLGGAALEVYLQRISELAKIMEGGKPDPFDLVEWLVRCAEQPATRWEGAYELQVSASMLFAGSEQDADNPDDTKEPEAGQSVIQSGQKPREVKVDEEENLVSAFAALLTESQKSRLVSALIAPEQIEERDSSLMSLVSHWNDPRLVPYLVSQLRRDLDDPGYDTEQMMNTVAETLSDKRLTRLSERFAELLNAPSEDDEQLTETEMEAANAALVSRQKAVVQEFLARAEKKMKR